MARRLAQLLTTEYDLSSHVAAPTLALSCFNSISGAQNPARPSSPSLPCSDRKLLFHHCLFRADSGRAVLGWMQFCSGEGCLLIVRFAFHPASYSLHFPRGMVVKLVSVRTCIFFLLPLLAKLNWMSLMCTERRRVGVGVKSSQIIHVVVGTRGR